MTVGGSSTSSAAVCLEHLASWARLRRGRQHIRNYQLQALQRLIRHAADQVPYYRQAFESAQVGPADLRSLDALAHFPISSKSDLQRAPLASRFAAGFNVENCRVHETSGSTGERLLIARTPTEELRLFGLRLRSQILNVLRPWHRRFIIGASPRKLAAHKLGVFRTSGVDLSLSPKEMLDKAELHRPHIIKGPPGALELLLEEDPQRLTALSLEFILSGAEQLPGGLRDRLEECCACRVIDSYGAVECNLIAWECRHCGMYHTCDDSVIVEVLNGDRPALPGQEGDVIVTALHSYAMPFIRYRIGDRVRLPASSSSCSIPFGVIHKIQGRSVDYLRFPGNIAVSPYQIMDQLDAIPEVSRYHVLQDETHSVRVTFEAAGTHDPSIEHRVRDSLKQVLPADVFIESRRVDRIDSRSATKRRFVQSRITSAAA
ncbi:MAG: AMP-binding protein [Acidobacteria bacterium]|nr:AMP-binding protein [Acidobacteriota bacterium]